MLGKGGAFSSNRTAFPREISNATTIEEEIIGTKAIGTELMGIEIEVATITSTIETGTIRAKIVWTTVGLVITGADLIVVI